MSNPRQQLDFTREWPSVWAILAGHPKLRAAYPDAASVALGLATYREILRDLPVDVVRAAVIQCVGTCDWLPTPHEIRAAASRLVEGPERTPLEAYGAAIEELSRAKAEARVARIADPVAAEVVKLMGGGGYLLCSTDQMADRAHFLREYERLQVKRRLEGEALPQALAELRPETAARRVEAGRPQLQLVAAPEPVETDAEREARRGMLQSEVGALLSKHWPGASQVTDADRTLGFRRAGQVMPSADEPAGFCRLCGTPLPDDDSGCETCRRRAEARRRELLAQAERAEGA